MTTAIRIHSAGNEALVELREGEAPRVSYHNFTPTPEQRTEIAEAIAKAAK